MLPFRDYNPSRTFPLMTITLIAINVAVFLYMVAVQLNSGDQALNALVMKAAVIPARFTPPSVDSPWWTILTAMFMHGGPLHIGGNMLYLWIFGNNIEDIMGSVRFLFFYLLCGLIATVAHILSAPESTIPSLGASGAIAGVLGAYLIRFPRAQIDTCIFFFVITIVRLPALIVLAFWFVLQFFNGVASLVNGNQGASGGVAYWAHIGGFVAGMLLVNIFAKRPKWQYNM